MPAWARRAHSGPEVIAKMTAPQMMALDQALAELNVPDPDPGRWAVQLAEVARHVANILAKLGFSSRAQIAAWVAQGRALAP